MTLPRLAVTIGDPAGIGPEVVGKALSCAAIYEVCRPVVVGDTRLIKNHKNLSKKYPCSFIDIPLADIGRLMPGRVSAVSGKASYEYTLKAVELIEQKKADALVTAPVSKAAMLLAGVHYPGQTELLASLTGSKDYAMLMIAGSLRTAMVTRHIPIVEVSKNLTMKKITDLVELTDKFLKTAFKLKEPRQAVCALNPHAGEGGMIGREDRMVILPAVKILKEKGINVEGPFPCDSVWQKLKKGDFDLLVTMYHDQTMIGLKCLSPEKIVNLTIGLPFVRTSPGHGTGFDIVGRNLADARPMKEAIKTAASLCS